MARIATNCSAPIDGEMRQRVEKVCSARRGQRSGAARRRHRGRPGQSRASQRAAERASPAATARGRPPRSARGQKPPALIGGSDSSERRAAPDSEPKQAYQQQRTGWLAH